MKDFFKIVFGLAFPIALQNLINTAVTTADVVMLGKVGETALSSGSLAGQVQFVMSLMIFGMTSGASVLTAQYWGKKEIQTIEKVFSMTLCLALSAGVLFFIASEFFPEQIMHIFSSETDVIEGGASYLRIVAFSYPMSAFCTGYLYLMRSIERAKIGTAVFACSLVANVLMNAVFIFGLLGMPALGVRGAALATLLSRCLEFALVVFYMWKINRQVRIRRTYFFRWDGLLLRDFLVLSIPVVLNETLWGAGMSANAAILGQLGSPAAAANSVVRVIRELVMVMSVGLSAATSVLVGKAIGEKRLTMAETYARRMVILSIGVTCCASLAMFSLRHVIAGALTLGPEAKDYLLFMLVVLAVYSLCQSVSCPVIVGVLRAGGDTRFGLILEGCALWVGSILMGWIGAFVLHLPVKGVFVLLMLDEFIKLPFAAWRYRSKVWLRDVTR
ncbi:MAG: MATE family efflux transporter [Lachnospiraceae bacterium]|nr:MATE family efflux transporter [Lachnospiraceae bacterium]MCI9657836.1 MATE family efflux transporter [Lachnospiraceae bacterium]